MPQSPTRQQTPRNVFRRWNSSLELSSAGLVSHSPSSIHQPLFNKRPLSPSLTRGQRLQVLPTGSNRLPEAPLPIQLDAGQEYARVNNWLEEARRTHSQSSRSSSQNIHEYRNNRETSPSLSGSSISLHNSSTRSLNESRSKLSSSDLWTNNYSMRLGTIPSPVACALAPGLQKYMADIPFTGNTTKSTHIHGHFFLKDSDNNAVICKVRMESGGSTNARIAHIKKYHNLLFLGLMEFRTYRKVIQQLEPEESTVNDVDNHDSRKPKKKSAGKEALVNDPCKPTVTRLYWSG